MVHLILLSIVLITFTCTLNKKNQQLVFVGFLLLFLFAALRYDFGNDYLSYQIAFDNIQAGEYDFGVEILFTALNKIFPSYYFMVAGISFAFVFTLYKLITKNVPIYLIGVSIFILLVNPYLFLMNLSALRQCLALCIFCYAIHFANKKQLVPYFLLIVLAMLFHKSAIILFPIYFLANEKKFSIKMSVVVSCITLGMLIAPNSLFNIISDFLVQNQANDYLWYLNNASNNSLRATLLSSITLVYILINLPKLNGKALLYSKLWLVGAIFNVLAYTMAMFTRASMYFDIFSIVAFPLMLQELPLAYKEKNVKYVVNVWILPILIIVVFFLRYYSFFTNSMWQSFNDYKTIFSLL